ncbi:queuosine precursor transporter [Candidatus Peregrinibacteria bacterium]|nr:queuosine precursor transporter [Candidatus Peregrinibacteria bacterium]
MKTKHLLSIASIYITLILISNITSTKIIELGGLTMDGGTLYFFAVYILGDVITEVYGFKKAKQIIWLGFFANILLAVSIIAIGALPPAADWTYQESYMNVLGLTPRIVVGSLLAYLAGSFSNAQIMHAMRNGKYLFVRTISSTLVGEGIDTLIFVTIAFYGVLPLETLIIIMISNYIIKCSGEILATPFTYLLVGKLKKSELKPEFAQV